MATINLNTKHISEFTPADTIYIEHGEAGHKHLFLCQFREYKKGVVSGQVLAATVNPDLYSHQIKNGWTISAQLSRCALFGGHATNKDQQYFHWFTGTGRAKDPLEEYKIVENDIHVERHPSFGIMQFKRCTYSGGAHLFGTSIKSSNVITLTISRCKHNRSYGGDNFFSEEELIEVDLSQSQFAELITTMNIGSGVPCTIRHAGGKRMSNPPYISKAAITQEEFAAKMHNLTVDIRKASETALDMLRNKPSLTKADRAEIADAMYRVLQEVGSNVPFVAEQFQRQMDKTITEAKGEVEAFVMSTIHNAGLSRLLETGQFTPPTLDAPAHKDEEYTEPDDTWPSRRWNKSRTAFIDLSGDPDNS